MTGRRNSGRDPFVVSDTVFAPPAADLLPYVTSKGAPLALARTLAVGYGADGIAVTVAFLASDAAAALTGPVLYTDGGLILR